MSRMSDSAARPGDRLSGRRIGVDGFNLSLPKGSGIATYGRNLVAALRNEGAEAHLLYGPAARIGKNAFLNEVALNDAAGTTKAPGLFAREKAALTSMIGRQAIEVRTSGLVQPSPASRRVTPDVTWAAQDLFHAANRAHTKYGRFTPVTLKGAAARPQVMHWTAPLPLKLRGAANLYTIHDLVPLRLPFTTLDHKRRFFFLCRRICRTADHIVTVSESAKQDIMRIFKVDERRITNTYQSVSLPPALLEKSDETVAREIEGTFGLGWRRYFLFYGAVEPKKNLARIIEAYLASGVTDPLVIVGADGWLTELETKLLYEDLIRVETVKGQAITRSDRVRRYDFMPLSSLVNLVRGAKATLFPSLFEGFGLPVLESMLLGTPVLTSSAGSLPEVAGDAALTVDPYDLDGITRGIRALDADEALREALVAKGRGQAARFTPAAYQDSLARLYGRLS
jgi:glycosyltransferase involved in cell wall biosynthesis